MKKVMQAIQMILISIVISLCITNVYAQTTGNIDGPNAGGSGNEDTIKVKGGFHKGDNGYRIYIVDSSSPTVLQKVIDIYFNDDPRSKAKVRKYDSTWVGNASATTIKAASEVGLSEMPEPIIWNGDNAVANGETLKKWMLSTYGGDGLDTKNATNGLYLVTQLFGETDLEAVDDLLSGDAKLVIEAVYWYRPNNVNNEQILDNGEEFYVYGTIKNIATWEKANQDLIGDEYGGQMKKLTSRVWTTALKTIRDEDAWGLYTVNRSDQLTYDEILEPYGYGIQVYESTDIAEQTQTYDPNLSVEGPAPQMPPLPDVDLQVARPITIVKLYTEKHTDAWGQVTENFVGCFKREDNCRTIRLMDETLGDKEYKMYAWATADHVQQLVKWSDLTSYIRREYHGSSVTCKDNETVLYVWLFRETRDPSELVDLNLRESEISRAFETLTVKDWGKQEMKFNWQSMEGVCDEKEVVGYHMEDRDGDGIEETRVDDTEDCNREYEIIDGQYSYILKQDENSIDETIFTKKDPFKQIIEQNKNTGYIEQTAAGQNVIDDTNLKFIIWRGDDIPTLASWKDSANSEIYKLIGSANVTPNYERKTKDYNKAVQIRITLDEGLSDIETTGGCKLHDTHGTGVTVTHVPEHDIVYNGQAKIDVYQGVEKGEADAIPNISELQSTSYKKGQIVSVRNTWIKTDYDSLKFYPYIRMTWQAPGDTKDQKNDVNILSQHISSMKASAAVSISWVKNTDQNGFNMFLKSDQWSNHAEATDGDEGWDLRNQVLPGGAIHAVQTKGDGTKDLGVTINVKGYYPFIPQSVQNETISYDASWTEGNGESEVEDLVENIEDTINQNYKLQMYVDNWKNKASLNGAQALSGIPVKNDTNISAITGKNGDKASDEIKYYLQDTFGEANSSNVNAHASSVNVATYTFSSDTEGNILMNGQVILKKNEGVEKLSGTAKEIDDYTKVVTNLVNSLTRNAGNDKSASWATDGKWYNEAYDGVQIAVYSAQIDVGIDGYEGLNYRSCVLDPNLTPSSAGQADVFSKANIFQYQINTNGKNLTAKVLDQNVQIPYAGDLLVSRYAFIPNINVQNLD